jgi:protein TonB
MSATPIPAVTPLFSPYFSQQLRRFGPLVLIIGLHVAFFYALQSGLLKQAAKAIMPKEIFVSLITEEPAPQPKPQPAEPKPVPLVKKTVTRPTPTPVIPRAPSPQAITEATPPQESKEPPAAAVPPSPPAPAAPAAPAAPKIVTGIEYIEKPNPVMPPASLRMGEEGVVQFKVLVNVKGKADKVEVIKSSGFQRLDDAAVNAVKRALFKPYIEDGKAIAVSTTGSIAFTISR